MNKANVEQIIRELIRQNYHLYPDTYATKEQGCINVEYVADSYYDNRNDEEIDRDMALDITRADYHNWAIAEVNQIFDNF